MPPGATPVTPGAGSGGGSSTGGLPPGAALGTTPFARQEGVYTPAAHEGAPGRGDGPESLLGGGGGAIPSGAVAGWLGTQPPRHCGCPDSLALAELLFSLEGLWDLCCLVTGFSNI